MHKLQEARKRVRKTQQQVADYLSVDRSTIAKWETYKYDPDCETLIKLADLYETTVDELLGIEKNPPPVFTDEELLLLEYFRKLNIAGQKAAIKVVQAYTLMPDYIKKEGLKAVFG